MTDGSVLLVDEISLADDSVLERMNSILEPERTLLLIEETSSSEFRQIVAHPDFQVSTFFFIDTGKHKLEQEILTEGGKPGTVDLLVKAPCFIK